MIDVAISGTGIYVPEGRITNEELVAAFNSHVDEFNAENAEQIAAGTVQAKQHSSAEFIEKASGIKSRHMIEASGAMDGDRMMPHFPADGHGDMERPSIQAAMAIDAAEKALAQAELQASDIDLVICSAAVLQRNFPAMGIEVQHFMGTRGSAFDMIMGCSSATFALINGVNAIQSGTAERVMMVNPEIFSTMVNYRDRDSHFIFGDVATAVIMERADLAKSKDKWRVAHTKQRTQFSSNIRSHYGPLTRLEDGALNRHDMFFMQEGRKVFKELLPLVCDFVEDQLTENGLTTADIRRMWLHQANANMNRYAATKLLGRDPTEDDAPTVLDQYGNTAGAGSVLSFHHNRGDLSAGDKGLICSFGAGYSIGSLLVEKL